MLRPMTVGEILDATFGMLRKHFTQLFGIVVCTQGPGKALELYANFSGGLTAHPGLVLFARGLTGIGGVLASAAVLKAISLDYLGEPVTIGDALGFSFSKFWPLIVAGIARGLVIALATVALIVPGIIVACGYACVTQIVVLEDLPSATDSLGRSWDLTKGNRNRAFGLGLAIFVIILIPSMAAGVLAALMPGALVTLNALGALLEIALMPLFGCAFTMFYYDLRIRKEGFDLEVLSRQLNAASV